MESSHSRESTMTRILLLVLLLTPELLAQVELPIKRESLSRRQRRALKERMSDPLEGLIFTTAPKEEVEKPLERENIARKPPRKEENQGDFDRLISRLRSLFRRELDYSQEVTTKIPGPPRLRPVREPSKIRSQKVRKIRSEPKRNRPSQVQVMGLPEDHPSWLGPIPPGSREWEDKHPVSGNLSALRIRAWSRKVGDFRPFHVRIKTTFAKKNDRTHPIREGREEGLVVNLPRHQIYQVDVWAGESLLPRTGYISLNNAHHDLIAEMLPWTISKKWKPVALDLSSSEAGRHPKNLSAWKQCLECMDLSFLALKGPFHLPSNSGSRIMELEDLMGWCMTSPRERPILPWQSMTGKGGSQLRALGCFEEIPSAPSSPESWIAFLQKARKTGGATFLQGIQNMEHHGKVTWSPLALMLFSGNHPSGLVLKDEGDWQLYQALLKRGFRLSALEPDKVGWSGQPFAGDHLLKFRSGSRQVVQALKEGRVTVGSGARIDFRIFDRPGGNDLAEVGDRWVPPSGNQIYQLLPKLTFELDAQSEGLRGVELWVNGEKTQPTPLLRPLKRGEALFSFEGLKEGDFLMAALHLSDGRRVYTNPIYVGENPPIRRELPLVIHLPDDWKKGFLLLRKESGIKEIELEPGSPIEVSTGLLSRLEIWSDQGEVRKTTPLDELLKTLSQENLISERESPLVHLDAMKALLPFHVNWSTTQPSAQTENDETP